MVKKWLVLAVMVVLAPLVLGYKINLDCSASDTDSSAAGVQVVAGQTEPITCDFVLELVTDAETTYDSGINYLGAEFDVVSNNYNLDPNNPNYLNPQLLFPDPGYGGSIGLNIYGEDGDFSKVIIYKQGTPDLNGVLLATPGTIAQLILDVPSTATEIKLYIASNAKNPIFGYVDPYEVLQCFGSVADGCVYSCYSNTVNPLFRDGYYIPDLCTDATKVPATITVLSSSTPPTGGLLGDVNLDVLFTLADSVLLKRHLAGISGYVLDSVNDASKLINADVDYCLDPPAIPQGQGVALADAVRMDRKLAGVQDFPCS